MIQLVALLAMSHRGTLPHKGDNTGRYCSKATNVWRVW